MAFHAVKLLGLTINLACFPTLGRASAVSARRVSLLIPARDEAARLRETLPGFLAQSAQEILVLDDCSTDATAAVVRQAAARDQRLKLLTGSPPPPGWVGKTWACQQLTDRASGDLLVFCDADVHLTAQALEAVAAEMAAQRAEVFSVFPRQRTGSLGERLAVPLIDEVLLCLLPHPLLRMPIAAAACANGQLLAATRGAYTALGGHAAVASEIVEDLALARRVRRAGLRLGLALGGELVQARMYDGYHAAMRGFGKSLRGAHGGSRVLTVADLVWHLTACTVPWLLLHRGAQWRAAAAAGMLERVLVNAKTGRGAFAEAALVPLTAPGVVPAVLASLSSDVRWKGRRYR